jgi:hypothetical protein
MCHRKPFFWSSKDMDIAYTTHRLLCYMLMLSCLHGFCCPNAPPRRFFANPIADGILASIFYAPHNLLHDLLYENLCVYPALVEMRTIIPKLNRGSFLCTGDKNFDYIVTVFLLVFVIGGGSNVLAAQIDGQRPYMTGFSPVAAAALAYLHRINIIHSTLVMTIFGFGITASRLYWTNIGWIVIAYPNSWFPRLMAWLMAGVAGSLLAKYHLENMIVWGDVPKFFGFT